MAEQSTHRRLTKFYGELSSLEVVLGSLALEGVDAEHPRASDLYTRGLDCQNLGTFPDARGARRRRGGVRDSGPVTTSCSTSAVGWAAPVDSWRTDSAAPSSEPTCSRSGSRSQRRSPGRREWTSAVSYRRADATDLPFRAGAFAQVWMLDVSMHIRD
jgi:hypothetical protein